MKTFQIKIRYCGYSADFNVTCEDSPQGIENSILDKLGKNKVLFEKNGFTSKDRKWITYEEVINCLLYTSPSPRDRTRSRMPSSA